MISLLVIDGEFLAVYSGGALAELTFTQVVQVEDDLASFNMLPVLNWSMRLVKSRCRLGRMNMMRWFVAIVIFVFTGSVARNRCLLTVSRLLKDIKDVEVMPVRSPDA